jgi:hypothetical protein
MVAICAALALCWSVFAVHVIIIPLLGPKVNRFCGFFEPIFSGFYATFVAKIQQKRPLRAFLLGNIKGYSL